jgi:hypothetical protein
MIEETGGYCSMENDEKDKKVMDELEVLLEEQLQDEQKMRTDQRVLFDKFRTGVDQKKIVEVKKQIDSL